MSDDWIMVSRSRIFSDYIVMTGIIVYGRPQNIGKYSYYNIINRPDDEAG